MHTLSPLHWCHPSTEGASHSNRHTHGGPRDLDPNLVPWWGSFSAAGPGLQKTGSWKVTAIITVLRAGRERRGPCRLLPSSCGPRDGSPSTFPRDWRESRFPGGRNEAVERRGPHGPQEEVGGCPPWVHKEGAWQEERSEAAGSRQWSMRRRSPGAPPRSRCVGPGC